MARDTLTGPSALSTRAGAKAKGRRARGKGKNKEKDKEKDPTANPDAVNITASETAGYSRKTRIRRVWTAVVQATGLSPGAAAAPSVTPSRLSMIKLDDLDLRGKS